MNSPLGRAAVLALAIAAACGGSTGSSDETVLRVSAPFGLSSFEDVNLYAAGSTANAADLLVDEFADHAVIVKREGRRVFLRPLAQGRFTAAELAASTRAPGLIRAEAVGAEQFVVELEDPSVVDDGMGFALGPYELDEEDLREGWVRLRSRGGAAIDIIEIIEVDATEQWRRLHAHAIDVVPLSPSASRDAYAGMSSVRTLDYPVDGHLALHFNTADPALADAAVRRALAAAVDRRAIAHVACGVAECALATAPARGATAALPAHLDVMVLASDSVAVDATRVLRLQLGAAGIDVTLARVQLDELASRLQERRYQLLVAPLPAGDVAFRSFRRGSMFNVSGWAQPAFDAAVDRGDAAAARQILVDEVPALPLFEDRQFAAVDTQFCGGQPRNTSWRWLADVYPCDEGRPP